MRRFIALAALLTLFAGQAAAQCAPPSARLLEGWHPSAQWPGWQLCYVRGVVVAGYRQDTDAYCAYDAATNRWGPATAPPWGARAERKQNFGVDESKLRGAGVKEARNAAGDLAAGAASAKALVDELVELYEAKQVTNFGVESSHIGRSDRYTIGGGFGPREVPRDEALRAVGNGSLTDDSNKPRLTVIGAEADRKRVLADFDAAPLAEWKGKVIVQAYAPDHWHVAKAGFKTDGKPTIYLQRPDGLVLHRQDDYAGGPQVLAQAIRKADPSYDPSKDGNLARPTPAPGAPDWFNALLAKLPVPPWVAVAIAAAAGLYYFRDKLPQAQASLAESFEKALPSARPASGRQPVADHDVQRVPPQGGSAMLPQPALIQSRPEISWSAGIRQEVAERRQWREEIKRRADEEAATSKALRELLEIDVPPPNPAPAPAAEPEKKG